LNGAAKPFQTSAVCHGTLIHRVKNPNCSSRSKHSSPANPTSVVWVYAYVLLDFNGVFLGFSCCSDAYQATVICGSRRDGRNYQYK
jgi:hypothetical protein